MKVETKVHWICVALMLISFLNLNVDTFAQGKNYRPQELQEQLQAVVDDFSRNNNEILGVLISVDIEGIGSIHLSQGFFDISREISLKDNDQFLIGSITKIFTSTLIHQLVEDGKLNLDDPVIDYLPSNWSAVLEKIQYGREITVRHAVAHRSGIYDTPSSGEFFSKIMKNPSQKNNPLDMLILARDEYKPEFAPGKSFKYSSLNYLLLGAVIENVTHKSYGSVLEENILSKIGLKNTFLSEGTFGSNKKEVSHGYIQIGDKLYSGQDFDSGWAWSAGAMFGNTEDLVQFIKALTNGQIFQNKKTFKKMSALVDGNEGYGLGIRIFGNSRRLHYGHSGYFGGTSSCIYYYPQQKAALAVCINFDGKRSRTRALHLVDLLIQKIK